MLVPVRRGELELFTPRVMDIGANPSLQQAHEGWSKSRLAFIDGLKSGNPVTLRAAWQKSYFKGLSHNSVAAEEHEMRRTLAPFVTKDVKD